MPGPSTIFILGKSYGTSFHAEKWLSLDVCGLMGATCSWGVHIYALIVVAAKLLSNSWIAIVIYVAFYVPAALLAMASLFKAWTTDPGAVPLGARPLTIVRRASSSSVGSNGNSESDASPSLTSRRAMRRCHKCNNNYKPPRAHHDSVTGRCIVKFDHFCPWVGNAVGALNHKFFCLFLFYTAITCLFSILLLILRAFHCGYTIEPDEGKEAFEGGEGRARALGSSSIYKFPECNSFYSSHLVIGLIICSLVFLVFTLTMGCEQIEAVQTGKSKIARMKMRVGNAGTEFRAVTEVCFSVLLLHCPRLLDFFNSTRSICRISTRSLAGSHQKCHCTGSFLWM